MTTPTDKSEVSSPATITIPLREYSTLQSQLTDLREQVERLHADGAVMRGGLDLVRSMLKVYSAGHVQSAVDTSMGFTSFGITTGCETPHPKSKRAR